jgi:hypothetical protein
MTSCRYPGGLVSLLVATLVPLCIAAAEPAVDFAIPSGVKAAIVVDSGGTTPKTVSTSTAFDVDPDGLPAIIDGPALKLFGSSQELLALDTNRIDDFAWMRDGKLLLVTQGHLATISPKGVVPDMALPAPGMRVRPAGANTAYVFGGADPAINRDVYLFARNGKMTKLLSLPMPVSAVAGNGTTTYVATERTILRIAFNEPVRVIVETRDPVTSLVTGPNHAFFYATKSAVGYVDRDGRAVEFIRGNGGLLRRRGSMLFVLLTDGTLLRLGPIDQFDAALEPVDNEIAAKPQDERVATSALLAEIEDRLYELNFDPSRRDGGFDEATAAVIKEYQRATAQLPTGVPTYGLLRALRAAGNRAPWGAIVYAKDLGKYGMSWGHVSRKAAIANAVASCGDPSQCGSEVSFFGSDCAAFAFSGKDWALTARDSDKDAREAALSDCKKHGGTCRLVAAVCADGSHHWGAGK